MNSYHIPAYHMTVGLMWKLLILFTHCMPCGGRWSFIAEDHCYPFIRWWLNSMARYSKYKITLWLCTYMTCDNDILSSTLVLYISKAVKFGEWTETSYGLYNVMSLFLGYFTLHSMHICNIITSPLPCVTPVLFGVLYYCIQIELPVSFVMTVLP